MFFFNQLLRRLILYGTNFTPDYHAQKKIKFINYIILPSLPLTFSLSIVNIYNGSFFLAGTNFLVVICNLITYIIHPFKKYDSLKLFINFILTIVCSVQAICYHNGMEYFHIQNLVLILIFFDERNFIIPSVIFSVIAFAITKYFILYYPAFIQPMELPRTLSNMAWATAVTLFGLSYFKRNLLKSRAALEKTNGNLIESNKTKEKIFSIIAHDFRAPIGQLKGTLNLVNSNEISKKDFYEISDSFYNQLDHLLNNMDNLLVWSQNQLYAIEAKPIIFSVKQVVEEVVLLLGQIITQKDIKLTLQFSATMVFADIDHMRIVFRNLLSNAVKFSKKGAGIYINTQIRNNKLIVQIKDEGVGMSEKQIEILLTDEYLASTSGTDNEKGTGLGLKICKEFLALNNGRIGVESELGKGTVFTVELPLAK